MLAINVKSSRFRVAHIRNVVPLIVVVSSSSVVSEAPSTYCKRPGLIHINPDRLGRVAVGPHCNNSLVPSLSLTIASLEPKGPGAVTIAGGKPGRALPSHEPSVRAENKNKNLECPASLLLLPSDFYSLSLSPSSPCKLQNAHSGADDPENEQRNESHHIGVGKIIFLHVVVVKARDL